MEILIWLGNIILLRNFFNVFICAVETKKTSTVTAIILWCKYGFLYATIFITKFSWIAYKWHNFIYEYIFLLFMN